MKTSVFQNQFYHVCHCSNYGYGLAVRIPGIGKEINGTRGWLIGGFSMQPAEYLKIMVVWYLSYILARQRQLMEAWIN